MPTYTPPLQQGQDAFTPQAKAAGDFSPSPAAPTPTTPQSHSVATFAQAVRTKYPNGVTADGTPYQRLSDFELANKIITKYPVYKSQVTDFVAPTTGSAGQAMQSNPGETIGGDLVHLAKGFAGEGTGEDIAGAIGAGGAVDQDIQHQQASHALDQQLMTKLKALQAAGQGNTPLAERVKKMLTVPGPTPMASQEFPAMNKTNEQIAGDFAQTGANIIGSGALESGAAKTVGGGFIKGALAGAGQGALAGGAQGIASGLERNGTGADVVRSAALGGVEGAAAGGAIGGLTGAATRTLVAKNGTTQPGMIENFQASRGEANNRGLAAPAQRLADKAPLIGAGAAREPKMTDVYNEAVNNSNAHLDDPTGVDKPIEKFGQNEVSNAFDQVVAQRKAAGAAMGAELDKPEVGGIKTNVTEAKQGVINELTKQKLNYDPAQKKIIALGGQSPMGNGDRSMLEAYINDLGTLDNKPTVSDVNNFIQRTNADLDLYKSKNQITGTTNGERIIKDNLTKLRDTISAEKTGNTALKPYSAAKAEFARLSPTVEHGVSLLGKPDLEGGYIRDASIAKRAVQSITNGGTKDFMRSLEKETGKPLLDHAYLILQAMKDTGDTSAHSLLDMFAKDASEGKMPSADTIRGKLMQFVTKHAVNKIAGSPVEQTQAFLKSIEESRPKGKAGAPITQETTIRPTTSEVPKASPSDNTSMLDKAKGILKDIKNNGNRGFVKISGFSDGPKGVTPESVAEKMDDTDYHALTSYVTHPEDVNSYSRAEPIIDAIGVKDMEAPEQERFLKEALATYAHNTTVTIKGSDLKKFKSGLFSPAFNPSLR